MTSEWIFPIGAFIFLVVSEIFSSLEARGGRGSCPGCGGCGEVCENDKDSMATRTPCHMCNPKGEHELKA
jgi:hypothetical protein